MHGMSIIVAGVTHAIAKWVVGYGNGFRCTLACGDTVVSDSEPPDNFRVITCVQCVARERGYYRAGWYQGRT